ncbi:hypothetical protein [Methanosarcina mazei]|uniref:Uncharacterized protein n=5 Tax=Methanosarcina mazei TaxID=2209 RepID=A0A0F8LQT0_METMZ|nr:hypothetical protein [Methanosarcina mazei]KKG06813.1 hypothetical protein DU47_10345 [Methanosarcina mazei]KKG38165.1 hypothetical protein DU30_08680 [Methanosarcina mazei]KKG68262.1 hypothetical protein DU67_05165 [Methanosarcina mazei]KKG79169.1 hypothetical protein DU55_19300 [Methanosarcina mazei]KKG88838.1 hypothetical protein DU69_18335 [Methanosarcina mazei]
MKNLKSEILETNITKMVLLSIAFTIAMVALASNASAAAQTPSYGTAIVDGKYIEWDLNADHFADMHEAYNANKDVLSKLYLRYNCSAKVMYVLVLRVPPYEVQPTADDAWVRIDSAEGAPVVSGTTGNDGIPPDFEWVKNDTGTIIGYEASFPLEPGTHTIGAHIQIKPGRTSGTIDKQIPLVINCQQREELTVTKTAVTSYTRTHNWDITKSVTTEYGEKENGSPKIWLYADGSGNEPATWTVDVKHKGYEDSDFDVSGVITIENTGDLPATITSIEDVLGGTPITEVNLPEGVVLPYTLPVGETLECSYSETVGSKIEGSNDVTVMTDRNNNYEASAEIIWSNTPNTENYKTITISDISDLFGEVNLGTVTAPENAQFTYSKDFAWEDYGKDAGGDYVYNNEATIVETGDSDDATLKVNVQSYMYETAYAKGDGATCFIPTFKNWGWTNLISPGTYEMDLWAGAAQCDTSKGTLVGSVTVTYGSDGYVTADYNVGTPYILEETHVYAGYEMFPMDKKGNPTVAPGAYSNASPFDDRDVYVIAHAVVGIPDPNFGPE